MHYIIMTYVPVSKQNEFLFWSTFVNFCKLRNIKVIYIGNENFYADGVKCYLVPRHMDDVNLIFDNPDPWLSCLPSNIIDICFKREVSFQKISESNGKLPIYKLSNFLEKIILQYNPLWIVAWSQLTPVSYLIREIGKKYHIPVFEAERSPLNDSIWIESEGVFDLSKIWDLYPSVSKDLIWVEKGKQIAQSLCDNIYGFRKSKFTEEGKIIKTKHLFFLPMDNIYEAGWMPQTIPISQGRYPSHPSPEVFIDKLNDCVASYKSDLLIKPHPSCSYLKSFNYNNIVDYDLKIMLDAADVVLCNYTKVAFPALALGKTVVTFVKNIILCSGVCLYYQKIEDFYNQDLEVKKDAVYWSKVYNFFGWLSSCYFYTKSNVSMERLFTFIERECT